MIPGTFWNNTASRRALSGQGSDCFGKRPSSLSSKSEDSLHPLWSSRELLGISVGWLFRIICLHFSSIFWGQLPQTAFHPQNWWVPHSVLWSQLQIQEHTPWISWDNFKMRSDLLVGRLLAYFIDTESPLGHRCHVDPTQCEPVSWRILSERYCKINYPLITSTPRAASMTREQECIPDTITHSKNMFLEQLPGVGQARRCLRI